MNKKKKIHSACQHPWTDHTPAITNDRLVWVCPKVPPVEEEKK